MAHLLTGAGAKRTLFLVPPSRFAPDTPSVVITCSGEAHAALARWASKNSFSFSICDRLPDDLMRFILCKVWRTWSLATRALRVSKSFATVATLARGDLPPGEWWTGSGLPLQVPKSQVEAIDLAFTCAALPREGSRPRRAVDAWSFPFVRDSVREGPF